MAALQITTIVFLAAFLLLAIIKTVLFLKNTRYKRIKYWFYFDKAHIINSSNEVSEKSKKQQNTFTVILAVVFFIELILLLMVYKSR